MRIGFYSPSLKLKKTATNFDSENTELPENKEKLHKKSAQKVKSVHTIHILSKIK